MLCMYQLTLHFLPSCQHFPFLSFCIQIMSMKNSLKHLKGPCCLSVCSAEQCFDSHHLFSVCQILVWTLKIVAVNKLQETSGVDAVMKSSADLISEWNSLYRDVFSLGLAHYIPCWRILLFKCLLCPEFLKQEKKIIIITQYVISAFPVHTGIKNNNFEKHLCIKWVPETHPFKPALSLIVMLHWTNTVLSFGCTFSTRPTDLILQTARHDRLHFALWGM